MGIPWWGWLIAGVLVGGFLLYRIALRSMSRMFRSISRTYLTNILLVLDPDVALDDGPVNRLRGTFQGRAIDLDLEPYFAAMTEALSTHPFREQMAVFSFLEASLPDHTLVSAERHRNWIRPKLITGDDLLTRQQIAPLPSTPLGDTGLHVVYVVDGENAALVFAITDDQMSPLGFANVAELHQHAIELMIPHTPREAIDTVLQQGEASAFGMHDGYVATRILAVQQMLAPEDSLVALIPDLDSCVLLPVPDDGDWSVIQQGAQIPIHEGEMLLNQPLLVKRDAIQLVAQ